MTNSTENVAKNVANEKVQDYVKKSHNVKENEPKSEKTTQDVQKNCSSLTKKWKSGELINEEDAGCYYIETIDGEIYPDCLSPIDGFKNTYNYAVKKILAPVPSYAEYMCLVDYKEELTKACKMRDKIIKKYQDIDTWWKAENQKLKELLKECREEISDEIDDCTDPRIELFAKIDEVLE